MPAASANKGTLKVDAANLREINQGAAGVLAVLLIEAAESRNVALINWPKSETSILQATGLSCYADKAFGDSSVS